MLLQFVAHPEDLPDGGLGDPGSQRQPYCFGSSKASEQQSDKALKRGKRNATADEVCLVLECQHRHFTESAEAAGSSPVYYRMSWTAEAKPLHFPLVFTA